MSREITLQTIRQDWKEIIEKEMTEGASITEISASLGIHRDTLYQMIKKFPEFREAIEYGKMLSEAWWLRQGRINLQTRGFNAVLWIMNMKGRFGWRDSPDASTKINIFNITNESERAIVDRYSVKELEKSEVKEIVIERQDYKIEEKANAVS